MEYSLKLAIIIGMLGVFSIFFSSTKSFIIPVDLVQQNVQLIQCYLTPFDELYHGNGLDLF